MLSTFALDLTLGDHNPGIIGNKAGVSGGGGADEEGNLGGGCTLLLKNRVS